jgi:hypothetical protein
MAEKDKTLEELFIDDAGNLYRINKEDNKEKVDARIVAGPRVQSITYTYNKPDDFRDQITQEIIQRAPKDANAYTASSPSHGPCMGEYNPHLKSEAWATLYLRVE